MQTSYGQDALQCDRRGRWSKCDGRHIKFSGAKLFLESKIVEQNFDAAARLGSREQYGLDT
jgi:hypothetical protein